MKTASDGETTTFKMLKEKCSLHQQVHSTCHYPSWSLLKETVISVTLLGAEIIVIAITQIIH